MEMQIRPAPCAIFRLEQIRRNPVCFSTGRFFVVSVHEKERGTIDTNANSEKNIFARASTEWSMMIYEDAVCFLIVNPLRAVDRIADLSKFTASQREYSLPDGGWPNIPMTENIRATRIGSTTRETCVFED